jgi:hypothetical protein
MIETPYLVSGRRARQLYKVAQGIRDWRPAMSWVGFRMERVQHGVLPIWIWSRPRQPVPDPGSGMRTRVGISQHLEARAD